MHAICTRGCDRKRHVSHGARRARRASHACGIFRVWSARSDRPRCADLEDHDRNGGVAQRGRDGKARRQGRLQCKRSMQSDAIDDMQRIAWSSPCRAGCRAAWNTGTCPFHSPAGFPRLHDERRSGGAEEGAPSPGADVAGVGAQSRRRCGRVGQSRRRCGQRRAVSFRPSRCGQVPGQMWAGFEYPEGFVHPINDPESSDYATDSVDVTRTDSPRTRVRILLDS